MEQVVSNQALLVADHLTVRRGGKTILDDVSVSFAPSMLTVIIGPNGAGKSTLLSALAGLIEPSAGDLRLDGTPLHRIPRKTLAKRRAYLPQNARCEWPLSVERVVALGLTPILPAFGRLPREDEDRVARALDAADLTSKRNQSVETLSGGELARTMLARAMVGDPAIVMTDEPTAGLDPRHAFDAMDRLKAVARSGRLVLTAIHDLPLAARYADRVIALKEGRLLADGTPIDIITSDFLKALYGVEARITADDSGLAIQFLA